MADYSKAFSSSFGAKNFTQDTIPGIDYKSAGKLNLSNIDFNKANSLSFNPIAFDTGVDFLGSGGQGWTFITAPEDVSWDIANNSQRVDIFGTNNPPVVAGSRGMRDLSLSNALVEGFVRNVSVEGKITALENLMNYSLNASDGFVSVPVYQVWANDRSYGGPEAYYIIKDVKVKESMRDLRGSTTRATVDISLMQVPAYQVGSGRDQASATTAGGVAKTQQQVAAQGAGSNPAAAAAAQVDAKNAAARANPSGSGAASPSPPPATGSGERGLGGYNLGI